MFSKTTMDYFCPKQRGCCAELSKLCFLGLMIYSCSWDFCILYHSARWCVVHEWGNKPCLLSASGWDLSCSHQQLAHHSSLLSVWLGWHSFSGLLSIWNSFGSCFPPNHHPLLGQTFRGADVQEPVWVPPGTAGFQRPQWDYVPMSHSETGRSCVEEGNDGSTLEAFMCVFGHLH